MGHPPDLPAPPCDAFEALLAGAASPFVQALLDAIPAPIFFKDANGVYRGCNAAFERFLGRSRAEIVGRTVEGVAPPELAKVYRAADDALFRSPGVQIYEA